MRTRQIRRNIQLFHCTRAYFLYMRRRSTGITHQHGSLAERILKAAGISVKGIQNNTFLVARILSGKSEKPGPVQSLHNIRENVRGFFLR